MVNEQPTNVHRAPAVAAVYVRTNMDGERLPNGVIWSAEYKAEGGYSVYAVDYHRTSGDIPSTIYDNTTALFGLIRGTKMLVDVKEVGGAHYATRVALDQYAEYRDCPRCAFMDSIDVTSADEYLDYLSVVRQNESDGSLEIARYEVPEDMLRYSSDRALLKIRCLHCDAEYSCRTSGEREAAGIHYTKLRHSFVDL